MKVPIRVHSCAFAVSAGFSFGGCFPWAMPRSSPKQSSKVTDAEYQALANFRYALRRFLHFSEDAAHQAGLAPQQHQALLAIKGWPDPNQMTVGQLAERLQIRHHSAVGLVDRLVAEKLVTRSQSKTDRRQVNLELTEQGEAVLERLSAQHREELRRAGPEIESLLQKLRQ